MGNIKKPKKRTMNELRQTKDSVYRHVTGHTTNVTDYDGIGDQGRTTKYEYEKNKVMKQLEKYYPIILAFISFLFSVTLWFTCYDDECLFVGIWVPSILGLANFFNTMKK